MDGPRYYYYFFYAGKHQYHFPEVADIEGGGQAEIGFVESVDVKNSDRAAKVLGTCIYQPRRTIRMGQQDDRSQVWRILKYRSWRAFHRAVVPIGLDVVGSTWIAYFGLPGAKPNAVETRTFVADDCTAAMHQIEAALKELAPPLQ